MENNNARSQSLTVKGFDYESKLQVLTEEERDKYTKIGAVINIDDTNSVQTYGSDLSKAIARCGDTLLNSVRSTNNDELIQLTNKLLGELNLINVSELNTESKIKAFLRQVPILKKLVQSVDNVMIKYDKIGDNVDKISKKIDSTRVVAMRDNSTLQTIFDADKEYVLQIREYILAAKIRLAEIQAEVDAMMAEPDKYEVYEIKRRMNFSGNLERRITDMQTTEYTLSQSLMQIEAIVSGNDQIAQRADNLVNNILPIWKNQLSNAIIIANQRTSIEAQNKTAETINKIISANAENIRKNATEIAKANENPTITLETLEKATKELIQMVKDVRDIQKKGSENRKNIEKALMSYSEQLETAVKNLD